MKKIPIKTSQNNYKQNSNLTKTTSGSLENIYEKIRDLKSEFQNVEEKMRMAVESLSLPQQNQQDTESDKLSSCDSGVSSRFSAGSSNGYYPGKIAERMERDRDYRSSLSNYPSSLSSGTVKERMEEDRSFMSSPIYPSSESSSTYLSPTPQPLTHCDTYIQIPVDRKP